MSDQSRPISLHRMANKYQHSQIDELEGFLNFNNVFLQVSNVLKKGKLRKFKSHTTKNVKNLKSEQ